MRKLLLFLMVMLLVGCAQKPKPVEPSASEPVKPAVEQNTETDSQPVPEEKVSNLFDAREIEVGDQVAGLKVVNIEVQNGEEEDYDAYVSFEGEATVSGTFKHNLDDEFLDHEISFKVDEEGSDLLPKLAHDERDVWFMFMNHDEAEKALGAAGTEGAATVTIRNYSINYAHTEIWNTADLVKAEISSE
jgi:hypothetical protein